MISEQIQTLDEELKKSKKETVIAVCSGGMDSTTSALYYLKKGYNVILLHFNYKQRSEVAEAFRLKKISKELNIPLIFININELGEIGGSPLTDKNIQLPEGFDSVFSLGCWCPARNVVFLAYTSALAERIDAKIITFGAESSESFYPDNTQEFIDRFNKMLEYGCLKPLKIEAPFINSTKVEELKWAKEAGFLDIYKYTWSCDEGLKNEKDEFIPCGRCGCCNSRRYAYYVNNIPDPQVYLDNNYFYDVFLKDMETKKGKIKEVLGEMKYA